MDPERKNTYVRNTLIGVMILIAGVVAYRYYLSDLVEEHQKNTAFAGSTNTPQSETTPFPNPEITPGPIYNGRQTYSKDGWLCSPLYPPIVDPATGEITATDWPLKVIRDLKGLPADSFPQNQGPYGLDRNGQVIEIKDYGYFSVQEPVPQGGEGICIKDTVSGTIFDSNANVPAGFDERVLQNIDSALSEAGYRLTEAPIPADGTIFDPSAYIQSKEKSEVNS